MTGQDKQMTDNLRVSLWLAERMGLQGEIDGGYLWIKRYPPSWENWQPHSNEAQLWQVVRWAAMNGIAVEIGVACIVAYDTDLQPHSVGHDGASIDAAVLMAIAKATGWEE